jgi:hypothetical protein
MERKPTAAVQATIALRIADLQEWGVIGERIMGCLQIGSLAGKHGEPAGLSKHHLDRCGLPGFAASHGSVFLLIRMLLEECKSGIVLKVMTRTIILGRAD